MRYHEKTARQKIEQDATTDTAGVVRWKSNNRVPFSDLLGEAIEQGVKGISLDACKAARDADSSEFFKRYAEQQANRTPEQLAEEAFEMRAAFGPGAEVVNVITGRVTKT